MAKPENVRIERGDGSVLTCELIHRGTDENGNDCWKIAGVMVHPGQDKVLIGYLPRCTALSFDGDMPDEVEDLEVRVTEGDD